jgi:transketolase
VLDLFRIKPIDTACLLASLADVSRIVTLEEHLLAGGMGSAVLEALVDEGAYLPTLRIGQRDTFMFEMGGREAIWEASGLDVPSMAERIARWVAVGQYPEPSRLAGARKA